MLKNILFVPYRGEIFSPSTSEIKAPKWKKNIELNYLNFYIEETDIK